MRIIKLKLKLQPLKLLHGRLTSKHLIITVRSNQENNKNIFNETKVFNSRLSEISFLKRVDEMFA